MFSRAWVRWVGATGLCLAAALPAAASLRLDLLPSDTTMPLSGSAPLSLVLSGLDDAAQIVSTFDIFVTFDPLIVDVAGVTFGTALGSPSSLPSSVAGTGSIELSEVSFLSDPDLALLQGDSVTLALLSFSGVGLGTSSIGFGNVYVYGAVDPQSSQPAALDPDLGGARITVAEANVPEPGSLLLLGAGLSALTLVLFGRGAAPRHPRS